MQIKDILAQREKIFGDIPGKKMEEQVRALRYIELISMQANIDITKLDILKAFKSRSGNGIITNPRFINKILFSFHEDNKELIKRASLEELVKGETKITKTVTKAIGIHQRVDNFEGYIATCNANITAEQNKPKEKQQASQIDYWTRQRDQYLQKIEALKRSSDPKNIIRDIARIVNAGFWKFLGVSGTKLKFITATDVILFERNPKSKLNIQKNMGTYLVKLDLVDMNVSVHTFRGNIRSYENIHPYVSSGGICFGNSGRYYNDAVQKRDIYEVMNMVGMVLGTYNSGGGPYATLNTFMTLSPNCKMTKEAEAYYRKKEGKKNSRVDELIAEIDLKTVSNGLAKTIGKRPEDASDQEYDEDAEYEADDEDDSDDEGDDEGYF